MIVIAAAVLLAMIARVRRTREPIQPNVEVVGVMAAIYFFDTLGIGSFAPSTAYFKLRKLVPDHVIPATLLVSAALFGPLQAGIFLKIIQVDTTLLISCIASAVMGGVFGARLAESLEPQRVRLVMGIGLLIAAIAMALSNLDLMPAGGGALSLPPISFAIAVTACFLFASLMNLGIGFYAPTLITMSLLGLEPRAAFPIMMGACSFLVPSASLRHLKRREVDMRIVTATTIGAIPGILLAAYLVKTLPLTVLRWVVIAIVLYAATTMLRSLNATVSSASELAPDNTA